MKRSEERRIIRDLLKSVPVDRWDGYFAPYHKFEYFDHNVRIVIGRITSCVDTGDCRRTYWFLSWGLFGRIKSYKKRMYSDVKRTNETMYFQKLRIKTNESRCEPE